MISEIVSATTHYGVVKAMRLLPGAQLRNKLLDNHQLKRFRKIVSHAYHNSEFYHEFYTKHGVCEHDIAHLTYNDIPLVTKNEITENGERVFTDSTLNYQMLARHISTPNNSSSYIENYYRAFATSGSLGKQMLVVYSMQEWTKVIYNIALQSIKQRPTKKIKVVGLVSTHALNASLSLFRDLPKEYIESKEISILDSLTNIIQQLNEFQADYIISYPGLFLTLASYQRSGELHISPKYISLGGEILTHEQQCEIENLFNARVTNYYAASECLMIGAKKRDENSFKSFPHLLKFEVLDENNEHVKPGDIGKIVITNFLNYTQPFIRYVLGDRVLYDINELGEPCIKEVIGRQYKPIYFTNNEGQEVYFHPFAITDPLLLVPEVEKSQVVISSNNITVLVAGSENGKATIKKTMQNILAKQNLDKKVGFSLKSVNQILPEANGKIPFVKYAL